MASQVARRRRSGVDIPGGLGDDPLSVLVVIVVVLISLPLVVVGVVAVLELLLLVALLPLAVLGRVLLGRHWHVELRQGWKPYWETEAGDWSQSGTVIHDVAARVQRGDIPKSTLVDPVA